MLLQATMAVSLFAMAVTLWMGFHLFARGFPSRMTFRVSIQGRSHIERGKQLQQLLVDSIELLKPAEKRPSEPLPRVWYNHAVLYDAYVEGVQNREIMARLYISEGTFNRTRRNAIRGLARLPVEKVNL